MLSTLLALLGVFLFVMGIWLVSYYNMKRRRKSYIHEKFGKIPKVKDWNDAVKGFYNIVNDGSGIDDITWNDLGMDQIFMLLNTTVSSSRRHWFSSPSSTRLRTGWTGG